MSRKGHKPINISDQVKVTLTGSVLNFIKDDKSFDVEIPECINVSVSDKIVLKRKDDSKQTKSLHGLTFTLINNALRDLNNKTVNKLEFSGTGYRAKTTNNKLVLSMGYSHDIVVDIPDGVDIDVVKNTITISGHDRHQIGDLTAKIRSMRPPEVYKGKGIRYVNELVKRKAGKAAQAAVKE